MKKPALVSFTSNFRQVVPGLLLFLSLVAGPLTWRAVRGANSGTKPGYVSLNAHGNHKGGMAGPLSATKERDIIAYCGACHAFPPPSSFPRWAWEKQVHNGIEFARESKRRFKTVPAPETILAYYRERAPEKLPRPVIVPARRSVPVALKLAGYGATPALLKKANYRLPDPRATFYPNVNNVTLGPLTRPDRLDAVICDGKLGVLAISPWAPQPRLRLLARVPTASHAEILDLDRDGMQDVLVTTLGDFFPTKVPGGAVFWLRGLGHGQFQTFPILRHLERAADVQVADFNGDGLTDLVVAVFGSGSKGQILYLENRTTHWTKPTFVTRVLDQRAGTINVPVCDLNGDGKPDFVAVISQEHEVVVAFINTGSGFEPRQLFAGPHPAYGSSGIQMVDLNGDGRLDVLYTNGDVLDQPHLIRPDNSVQWLENRGGLRFEHHNIAAMPGVERAVAADFDGDGLPDIAAVSFLPREFFARPMGQTMDSVIFLRQNPPGHFERYSLEKDGNDHVTCAAGDVDGNGMPDLVSGNLYLSATSLAGDTRAAKTELMLWRNFGKALSFVKPRSASVPVTGSTVKVRLKVRDAISRGSFSRVRTHAPTCPRPMPIT